MIDFCPSDWLMVSEVLRTMAHTCLYHSSSGGSSVHLRKKFDGFFFISDYCLIMMNRQFDYLIQEYEHDEDEESPIGTFQEKINNSKTTKVKIND